MIRPIGNFKTALVYLRRIDESKTDRIHRSCAHRWWFCRNELCYARRAAPDFPGHEGSSEKPRRSCSRPRQYDDADLNASSRTPGCDGCTTHEGRADELCGMP